MRSRLTLTPGLVGLLAACASDQAGPPLDPPPIVTTSEVTFARHRDGEGRVTPILQESGAGFDALQVDSPAVAYDPDRLPGGRYILLYEATGADGLDTIGLITADGPDFSSPGIARTQILDRGAPGSGFDGAVTDPTLVVDPTVPLGSSGRYRCWFEGRDAGGSSALFTTESGDLMQWTSPVRCVGIEPSYGTHRVADPTVLHDNGTFRMWFEAILSPAGSADGPGVIGYAESGDGVNWTVTDALGRLGAEATPVFEPNVVGTFDRYSVNAPSVVRYEPGSGDSGNRYLLWYEAGDTAGATENTLGLARSPDGLTWSRLDAPVLAPSSDAVQPPLFDSGDLEQPAVLIDAARNPDVRGHILLWYAADSESSQSPNRIGLAEGLFVQDTP